MRANSFTNKTRIAGGLIIALAVAGTALAGIGGGTGPSLPGRMTGGGSIVNNGLRVTHGSTLNCDGTRNPQRLEVNWNGNKFHLEQLNTAFCSLNPSVDAGHPSDTFNTCTGSGVGRFNGVSGVTSGLDLSHGAEGHVELEIGADGGSIEGSLGDADGRPIDGARS